MKLIRCIPVCAILLNHFAWGETQTKAGATSREWSNTEGKVIRAEYLGVRDVSVMVRLGDGRVVPIALAKLSEADKTFIRDNPLVYREAWKAWPADVEKPMAVDVKEIPSENGKFIYQTQNFRFSVNGNLGTPLMKDLAQVFELTHALHLKSPFGLLAKPQGGRFEAKLYGTTASYHNDGGPLMTAGVYLPKTKIFMAPLSLMGVKVDGSVWRRIPRSQTDTSTIVHELTHMLTHDMLVTLPIWVNEGYAEYIANIPIEKDAFRISAEAIRQGVVDSFVLDYEKWLSKRGGRIEKLGPAD